jgi:hypothetical protein
MSFNSLQLCRPIAVVSSEGSGAQWLVTFGAHARDFFDVRATNDLVLRCSQSWLEDE